MSRPQAPVGADPSGGQSEALAGPSRRGPIIALTVVSAALLVALAVAVPLFLAEEAEPPNLDAVVVLEDLSNEHVEEDVDYDLAPPAGGPHDPAWHACGAYDAPIRTEHAVHSLEHGTVWITHRADLDGDEVNALAATLPDEGILSPYSGQEAPVVVTVWGRQLALTGADDPRLRLFLDRYGDGHTSPEPFASCEGGVRASESGQGGVTACVGRATARLIAQHADTRT